ncbi:MAG: hypothetical protein QNJ92_14520 [Alphaproteobacteria bacterium]|nr:hypothetical protein [Alphaproteobacteria bacterium]
MRKQRYRDSAKSIREHRAKLKRSDTEGFYRQEPEQAFDRTNPNGSSKEKIRRGQAAVDMSIKEILAGAKPKDVVIKRVFRERRLGWMDIMWGKSGEGPGLSGGEGISHVLAKHGIGALQDMFETILHGQLTKLHSAGKHTRWAYQKGKSRVIVRTEVDKLGETRTVITSYRRPFEGQGIPSSDFPINLGELRSPLFFSNP